MSLNRCLFALAFCLMGAAGSVRGAELSGRVVGVNDGRGVPGSSVTLTYGAGAVGPKAITVFTGEDGSFHFPANAAAPTAGSTLQAGKLGYQQLTSFLVDGNRTNVKLAVEPTANIALSVP